MNRLNYDIGKYPLTVERMAEMQATYQHLADAIATWRDRQGVKRNFIFSGCRRLGDSGYIVFNDELYNVLSSNDNTCQYLKVVATEVTDTIDGEVKLISTERHLEWVSAESDSDITYSELMRFQPSLEKQDTNPINLSASNDSGIMVLYNQFSARISNGDIYISGEHTFRTARNGFSLQLPTSLIPIVDSVIPVRINDGYLIAIVRSDNGVILIDYDFKENDTLKIDTVINARYTR